MPTAAPLAWAAAALTAVVLLPAWARSTLPAATDMLRRSLHPSAAGIATGDLVPAGLILPAIGLVLAAAVAGLAVRFACDGFTWEPGRLAPRLTRVDPAAGVARILSTRTLLLALGGGIGLMVLAGAAALASAPLLGTMTTPRLDGDPAGAALAGWWTLVGLATASLAVGAAQYAVARLRFERRIRMTAQEFADELAALQADPKVRAQRPPARR